MTLFMLMYKCYQSVLKPSCFTLSGASVRWNKLAGGSSTASEWEGKSSFKLTEKPRTRRHRSKTPRTHICRKIQPAKTSRLCSPTSYCFCYCSPGNQTGRTWWAVKPAFCLIWLTASARSDNDKQRESVPWTERMKLYKPTCTSKRGAAARRAVPEENKGFTADVSQWDQQLQNFFLLLAFLGALLAAAAPSLSSLNHTLR